MEQCYSSLQHSPKSTRPDTSVHFTAQLTPVDGVCISDIVFHTEGPYCGYILAVVRDVRYARELAFRVFDPRCDQQQVLVLIDYGQLSPTINRHWKQIEKRLQQFCILQRDKLERDLTFSLQTEGNEPLPYKGGKWSIKESSGTPAS